MEFIYEVLIRGTPEGHQRAHVVKARQVADEEGDLHIKEGKPQPIEIEDLRALLGEDVPRYIAQIESLTAQLSQERANTQKIMQVIEKRLTQTIESLNAQCSAQTAVLADLVGAISEGKQKPSHG